MEMDPNSEALFPKISSTSSIAELIEFLRSSYEENDFKQVENILTARENSMKLRIENLEMDRYWVKEPTPKNEALLKVKEESRTKEDLLKLDGLRLQRELERSQCQCAKLTEQISRLKREKIALNQRFKTKEGTYVKSYNELKEKMSRSVEDQRKLDEEKKRIEERYGKDHEEYWKKIEEKGEMILQLNKRTKELENQKLESEQTAEMYKLKVKSFDLTIGQKNGEIEELKRKISEADQVVVELRSNEEKYVKSVEELNEKLHTSQMEHNKSKEEIIKLIEYQREEKKRIEDQREEKKRIEDRYAKDYEEYLKKTEEKDDMILEMSKKITDLENEKLESEHTAEMYKLKAKSSDIMIGQKNEEVDEWKRKKSEADAVVEELRCKLLEADQNLEAQGQRFETLNARVRKVEHDLANILNVSVNDLRIPGSGCENDVSARQTHGNEMNSVPLRGQRATEPVRKHVENAGCSRGVVIIKIEDSDDEEGKEEEGSLVSSTPKRKRSTNGNENNDTSVIGVHKEKMKRELTSGRPFHGTNVSVYIDSDNDSITSSHIEEGAGL